jgi:hypothetical protein
LSRHVVALHALGGQLDDALQHVHQPARLRASEQGQGSGASAPAADERHSGAGSSSSAAASSASEPIVAAAVAERQVMRHGTAPGARVALAAPW